MATHIVRAKRYFERGVYYYELGSYGEAVANLRDALELLPTHFSARMYLGAALAKQSRFLDAVRTLEEGRQMPLDDDAMLKLLRLIAMICAVRQDFPAARYYLRLALQLAPDDAALLNLAAGTFCRGGELGAGLQLYFAALDCMPSSSPQRAAARE